MNTNRLLFLLIFVTSLIAEDHFNARFNYFGNLTASKLSDSGYYLNDYSHDGITDSLSLVPYSKVGGQLSVYNDAFTFTAQALLRKERGEYKPDLTWLNIKYDINDNLALRLGKIQTKVLLNSESLDVDYLQLWAKPPVEVYRLMPIRTFNGLELTYNQLFNDYNFQVSIVAFASNKMKINLNKETEKELKVHGSHSIAFTLNNDTTTYKASLSRTKVDLETDAITSGIVSLLALNPSNDMSRFTYDDRFVSVGSLGFSYRDDDFIFDTELARSVSNGLLPSSTAGYVMLGYNINKFTPFAIYSRNENDKSYYDTSSVTGYPLLKRALDDMLYLHNFSQETVSLGMKYDIQVGMSFKAQVDRTTTSNYGSISSNSVGSSGYERIGILSRFEGTTDKPVYAFTMSLNFAY